MATCCVSEGVCEVNQHTGLVGFPTSHWWKEMIHCFTRTHVSQSTLRVDSSSQDMTEPNLLIWSPGWALRNAVSPSDGVCDLSRELERDAGALRSLYKPLGSLWRWGAGETGRMGWLQSKIHSSPLGLFMLL